MFHSWNQAVKAQAQMTGLAHHLVSQGQLPPFIVYCYRLLTVVSSWLMKLLPFITHFDYLR
jgi:hypothetical protein